MKKFRNRIIPLVMIVGLFALLLCGCGKSKKELYDEYTEDSSNVFSMDNDEQSIFLYEIDTDFSDGKSERQIYSESMDESINEAKAYKMKTKEGKAVQKSIVVLRKKEKEFRLKYSYGDYNGTVPDIQETLKKYYEDVEKKISKFDEKYKEVCSDVYVW